jgi:hypothetical protein
MQFCRKGKITRSNFNHTVHLAIHKDAAFQWVYALGGASESDSYARFGYGQAKIVRNAGTGWVFFCLWVHQDPNLGGTPDPFGKGACGRIAGDTR